MWSKPFHEKSQDPIGDQWQHSNGSGYWEARGEQNLTHTTLQYCKYQQSRCTAVSSFAWLVFLQHMPRFWLFLVRFSTEPRRAFVRGDGKCASTATASRCDAHLKMGRLSKTSMTSGRPNMKVHYRKLVDEYSGQCDSLKFVPTLPEYLSYCCHHCGHQQKLKVNNTCSVTEAPKCRQNVTCFIKHVFPYRTITHQHYVIITGSPQVINNKTFSKSMTFSLKIIFEQ